MININIISNVGNTQINEVYVFSKSYLSNNRIYFNFRRFSDINEYGLNIRFYYNSFASWSFDLFYRSIDSRGNFCTKSTSNDDDDYEISKKIKLLYNATANYMRGSV